MLGPAVKQKGIRRHGELVPIGAFQLHAIMCPVNFVVVDESQPVKLVMQALPGIEQFVSQQLEHYPSA